MKPRLLDTELAWAAGFFDGEGSVSLHRDKRPGRKPLLHLDIEQVDIRPLLRFRAAIGLPGNISLRPSRSLNRKPIHRVYMAHAEASAAVAVLWPYLSEPKREQIIAALGRIAGAA